MSLGIFIVHSVGKSLLRRRDEFVVILRFLAREFVCCSRFWLWRCLMRWISSFTAGIFRSKCKFSFRKYQGAPVIVRRIFDCTLCITSILLALALPHNWDPYVQIGFIALLYIRALYSNLSFDLAFISQCSWCIFMLIWVFFDSICFLHVILRSRCMPK